MSLLDVASKSDRFVNHLVCHWHEAATRIGSARGSGYFGKADPGSPFGSFPPLAAADAHAGRPDESHRGLAAFLGAKPGASLALVAAAESHSDQTLLEHLLDGLRKAGPPD